MSQWSLRGKLSPVKGKRWWPAEWQLAGLLGHYGNHPRPWVADRGTPSRVAQEGSTGLRKCRGQTVPRRRKTLIPNRARWSSLSIFRQIRPGEGNSDSKPGRRLTLQAK